MSKSILKDTTHEIEIKRSRFICYTRYVVTKQEAINFIDEIKALHPNATHNCSCYLTDGFEKVDDDGEPSMTAGMPMLEVVKHHELENICVVVTRYFGGVKLGGGGLIRAYAKSVSELINHAEIACSYPGYELSLNMAFSDTKLVDHFIKSNDINLVDREFSHRVIYKIQVFCDEYDKILSKINSINHLIDVKIEKEISLIRS